ncbi:MAG: DUF4139 domain-containing protein [Planctomycetaceae bacterium]|nr:DUF4139 domain-containing protein [Planctomycetaceae bacterium]
MVTREAALPAEMGTFELVVKGLPPAVDGDSLAARVEGGRLLDIRYEEARVPNDPTTNAELKAAIAERDEALRTAESFKMQLSLLDSQSALLDAVAQKTAAESGKELGSKALDPAALAAQIEYLAGARLKVAEQKLKLTRDVRELDAVLAALGDKVRRLGGTTNFERSAVIAVGKSTRDAGTVRLSYLVENAGWTPEYSVRALDTGDDATDALTVEYAARILQESGEDWNDVTLTLSTAEPTRQPSPRGIRPLFLDVFVPPPPTTAGAYGSAMKDGSGGLTGKPGAGTAGDPMSTGGGGGSGGFGAGLIGDGGIIGEPGEGAALGVELEKSYADAEAVGSSVVTYTLPRKVRVPSDGGRSTLQRVAAIDLKPEFAHVARPLVDDRVYLRAKTRNDSSYTFLEGTAKLFVGDDSVGAVEFPEVPPGASLSFWFGGDPRFTAKQTLVSRQSGEEGVFGKSKVETAKWRIDLSSSAAGATSIEVEAAIPVSRNEKIKVELRDLSMPLSTAEAYLKGARTQGVLRWVVPMPGRGADGKPVEKSISWTARTIVPVDVQVTQEVGPEITGDGASGGD